MTSVPAVFAVPQLLTGALMWLTPGFFYEEETSRHPMALG